METRAVRVLLVTLGVGWSAGCMPPEQSAAAPRRTEAPDDHRIEREQRELEQRRAQLQQQLLGELRKLRESRQASTSGAEPSAGDDADHDDLVVFGGATHEVYLGCLCDQERPDSVFNLSGEHGSDVSPASIRNKFSPYGSNHDDTSVCDAKATHPPVVLTSEGKSLGLLTVNPDLKRRITTPSVADWLTRMCDY
jgi:hypothetical protein